MQPKLLYIAVGFPHRLLHISSVYQFSQDAPELFGKGNSLQVGEALLHWVGPHMILFTESDATLLDDMRKNEEVKGTWAVAFHTQVSNQNVKDLYTYLEENKMGVTAAFNWPALDGRE